jgi:hypothetical protein
MQCCMRISLGGTELMAADIPSAQPMRSAYLKSYKRETPRTVPDVNSRPGAAVATSKQDIGVGQQSRGVKITGRGHLAYSGEGAHRRLVQLRNCPDPQAGDGEPPAIKLCRWVSKGRSRYGTLVARSSWCLTRDPFPVGLPTLFSTDHRSAIVA